MKYLALLLCLLPLGAMATDAASEKFILYRSMQRDHERAFEKMESQRTKPIVSVLAAPLAPTAPKTSHQFPSATAPSDLTRPVKGELLKNIRSSRSSARKEIKPLPKVAASDEGRIAKEGSCIQKLALQAQVIERQRAMIKKLQQQLKSTGKTAQ